MSINTDYDVLVIGSGPAGENAGARAAADGLRVALIERELLGGECSYWACMPSKALLRPGEAVAAARRAPGAAAAVTGEIDIPAALHRRDLLAANWDDSGQVSWAEGAGLAVIKGHGRIAGIGLVSVTDDTGAVTTYQAGKAVVIATGTAADTGARRCRGLGQSRGNYRQGGPPTPHGYRRRRGGLRARSSVEDPWRRRGHNR